ncbi:MAG TPA: HAMP domain-containing histidine kinase [Clostridiaceae bacterium]|nr:HAMP domain-containing histidine kinase [Clostridiaceae bacterium]
MSFFRNPEIKIISTVIAFISLMLVSAGFIISIPTGLLVLLSVIILCMIFLLFTIYRYRKIRELSEYLRRLCKGEQVLDVRDNREGELSILKSEIYKVTLMLSEYNERLIKEKAYLSEQLADISHQIKTPLTSMMVMADLLRNENLPPDKRIEFTSHIYSQLERLKWLVSSLLTISRLDAGVVKMKGEKVLAKDLIKDAINPLLVSMELKEIEYSMDGEENYIKCDLRWTAEAIINILKNCVEHTPKGGKIQISVADNPLFSEIKIADNGKGIEKEDLPHIFSRFYRGKGSMPESAGIGLAMSKSIIEGQGGEISVDSKPGKGSTFTIRLNKTVL